MVENEPVPLGSNMYLHINFFGMDDHNLCEEIEVLDAARELEQEEQNAVNAIVPFTAVDSDRLISFNAENFAGMEEQENCSVS